MTNREAVNWLINLKADIGKSEHRALWHYEEALDEIGDLLGSLDGKDTNVPSNDTISRQATITEIKNYERDSTAPIDYVKIVELMPPAQPEQPVWAKKVDEYRKSAPSYIVDPLAWALYQVWKEYDEKNVKR